MKVLLDTCAITETIKPTPNPGLLAAIEKQASETLFLSVLTIGEIHKGIELLAPGKKRATLSEWLSALQTQFANRILPVDAETSLVWGELTARAQKKGVGIPAVDGYLAATAIRHGLLVMTRNENDFKASGVSILNPWDEN